MESKFAAQPKMVSLIALIAHQDTKHRSTQTEILSSVHKEPFFVETTLQVVHLLLAKLKIIYALSTMVGGKGMK